MNFIRIFLGVLFVFSCSQLSAQQESYERKENRRQTNSTEKFEYNSSNDGKKWDWSKVRVGGNFALSFGTQRIFVETKPTFGYQINQIVELGVGMNLQYYRERNLFRDNNFNTFDYSSFTYGPLAYGRFTVWNGIFVMAQYEMANKNPFFVSTFDQLNDRINVHHLLVGGGYSQPIGNNGNLNIGLLYEVINDPESLYQFGTFGNFPLHLTIGVGFGFGR